MILIVIDAFVLSGSPFAVNVMDTQRVVVFGKGLGSVPVNIPATFTVLTQNAGVGELRCSIKGGVENSRIFFSSSYIGDGLEQYRDIVCTDFVVCFLT